MKEKLMESEPDFDLRINIWWMVFGVVALVVFGILVVCFLLSS